MKFLGKFGFSKNISLIILSHQVELVYCSISCDWYAVEDFENSKNF